MAETFRRRVYLLSHRRLSPETIAVTFAKTSRSPQSFDEIADQLNAVSYTHLTLPTILRV